MKGFITKFVFGVLGFIVALVAWNVGNEVITKFTGVSPIGIVNAVLGDTTNTTKGRFS